ncbi:hypothetical protein [Lamprocystis purpurea]|jgi:predicted nucleotidyltransferase|uniref:hypothetical protein n=1 Tax=Lamprocystis purpurea TaxID=61598 RepID=UPI0006853A13|nr:hypothetical protein [Lamprocystis purpurea]
MIATVARALGAELLERVAFLGGCATGLLVTDEVTREAIRHTQDVDLIIGAVTLGEWTRLKRKLELRGFRCSPEDDIICRMRLDTLIVDFMPQDEQVLGFTNRWYALALETAQSYRLTSELTIPLVTPALFVATKLEAYRGRGRNDPLASHDLEDLINLFDGRADIVEQIAAADAEVRRFIAIEIAALLQNRDFSNAVSGNLRDSDREDIVVDRLESVAVLV